MSVLWQLDCTLCIRTQISSTASQCRGFGQVAEDMYQKLSPVTVQLTHCTSICIELWEKGKQTYQNTKK